MTRGGWLLRGLAAALVLTATVAVYPSMGFVNLYKSSTCNYGPNTNDITLASAPTPVYTDIIFSQPSQTTNQFVTTSGNNVGGTLTFSTNGGAPTSIPCEISRLSKSDDGVTQDVEAFYCVDDNSPGGNNNDCAYLLVTKPYKPPYDSNDIFTDGATYPTSAENVLGPINEYNDLSNGFVTLEPTPATLSPTSSATTGAPSKQPTTQPTTQPTKQPTHAPTQAPTARPTLGPTPAPTQYPTFQPPPPGPQEPVPVYSGPYRCGPEVALYGADIFLDGRRLEEEREIVKANLEVMQEHRVLQQSDLDRCYTACKNYFAPDNRVFIFQVYWEDNKKLCGCCRECVEQIPVQYAQVYSTPCPSPENGLVISTRGPSTGATASNGVASGRKHGTSKPRPLTIKAPKKGSRHISFAVRVHTPIKGAAFSNFGVQVFLPPGVAYSYSSIKPTHLAMPTVNGDVGTGHTVTWSNLVVRYKRPINIKVHAAISRNIPTNTPLTFSAATFTPGLGGAPTCLQSAGNTTVTVVA